MINTSTKQKERQLKWVKQLTSIPTASGCEHRVVAWIENWLKARKGLGARRDKYGNIVVFIKGNRTGPPVLFTAHLDHPAFVIKKIVDEHTYKMEFRGGVNKVFFENGKVLIYSHNNEVFKGNIVSHEKGVVFDEVLVKLANQKLRTDKINVKVGDIATWDIKTAHTTKNMIYAPGCDDLAGVAAALSALDILSKRKNKWRGDVRLLFTRAEEVGFVGAIRACSTKLIPKNSKIIALENSRSFADSPIGGGPIVRVGDRISIFHHGLTYSICQVAENLAKKSKDSFKWQRKLMPGGACEATAFQAYGYEATCLCLPLGNYHNQGDIDAVLAGNNKKPAKAAAEYIGISDYHNLIILLVKCGYELTGSKRREDGAKAILLKMEQIISEKGFVLNLRSMKLSS